MSHQELAKIQQVQLKFLQKFNEFEFDLETLQEELPFKASCIQLSEMPSDTTYTNFIDNVTQTGISSVEQNYTGISTIREPPTHDSENLLENVRQPLGTFGPQLALSELNSIREGPTHDIEISENVLQNIRDNLRTFSTKIGFSEQNISSMRKYYSKHSSTSNSEHLDTQNATSSKYVAPYEEEIHQIPEKDESNCIEGISQTTELCSGDNILKENKENLDGCEIDLPNSQENYRSSDSSINLENEGNHLSTSRHLTEPCTAIEKLNNLKLTGNSSYLDIKPLELPDLTLIAASIKDIGETVIRNVKTPNKRKNNNVKKPSVKIGKYKFVFFKKFIILLYIIL